MTGLLLVDKTEGPTSHDVINIARKKLGERRVGHVGTLDPFASGLLVVLVGRATRLAKFLVGLEKRYTGIIKLGAVTDTDDFTGQVLEETDRWRSVEEEDIDRAMKKLCGKIQQVPPAFSAKKVAGVRAYSRARRGEAVELSAQTVEVSKFDLVQRTGADVHFDVTVSSGTYIRSLARDLGRDLGVGGHLLKLRRESVGDFKVTDAVDVHEVTADSLRPAGDAVYKMKQVVVTKEEGQLVRHGNAVREEIPDSGPVALFEDRNLIAIAEVKDGALYPKVVLG
ncbi:MAG: tRNA pseudouridine(55) synthase TruB [Gemmatimonadota bacterium]|nr:tRNA pseudouridine(55) synthase TruB [Gemmatimonadota bacterium]MDH5804276.1 tRNA pseudouridine(55) synthase TruB [Gemmatimonadota bacterium]